jgi:hypothetical protein
MVKQYDTTPVVLRTNLDLTTATDVYVAVRKLADLDWFIIPSAVTDAAAGEVTIYPDGTLWPVRHYIEVRGKLNGEDFTAPNEGNTELRVLANVEQLTPPLVPPLVPPMILDGGAP